MDQEELKEQIKKRKDDKWFETLFSIEALAIDKETVESSLKQHVEKMKKTPNIFVYDVEFYETNEVENPLKNIERGFSQIVNVKLFIKDMYSFLNTVTLFGPSAIEVLGPDKKDISLSEVQNIVNHIAGLVHQFAAAGMGGLLIMAPDNKGQEKN